MGETTPISEGALIQREWVLAFRAKIERMMGTVNAREKDLIARQNRLTMVAEDNIDKAIDENVLLSEALKELRLVYLELDKLLIESFEKEEELLNRYNDLEQRFLNISETS